MFVKHIALSPSLPPMELGDQIELTSELIKAGGSDLASEGVRSMLSSKTTDTIQTGPRCLYSPSFLSKNQLVKEGSDSVAPVVIPALTLTLEKSLKADHYLYS